MSAATVLIIFFAVLIVVVPLVIFLLVNSKRDKGNKSHSVSGGIVYKSSARYPSSTKPKPAKPVDYGKFVLSTELKQGLVTNCLSRSKMMPNNYIYGKGDYVDYYDEEERKDMGEVFEHRVLSELKMYLKSNSDLRLVSQWRVCPGAICDFALVWKDVNNRRRTIVIECKRSNSRDEHWINEQLEKGIDQLYRYKKNIEIHQYRQVDLLALFTSFPWKKGRPAQLIHNVLVINCDSMVGVFMDEVKKFHKNTIIPAVKEMDDFAEDNLNIVG